MAACQSVLAQPRTLQQAKEIAAKLMNTQTNPAVAADFGLAEGTAANEAKGINGPTAPSYYILNHEGEAGGFVIVGGDSRLREVLAYSATGHFTAENLPDGLSYWLRFIDKEIAASLASGNKTASGSAQRLPGADVAPMLKSHWTQSAPFNQAVPVAYESDDPLENATYKGHAAVGCVALGVAQTMNFWKYPAKGQGGIYEHAYYGDALSLNFDEQTYNWDLIQDNYGLYLDGDPDTEENIKVAETTPEQDAEVAKLCYHIGLGADMLWNADDDGESATQGVRALRALVQNFGYNPYAYVQARDPMKYEDFHALIVSEIAEGRPVMYSGEDKEYSGHFFVLDGYDATHETFHVNWGWQGSYDGYYALTALEPGTDGIGAGNGNYNYDQCALIGVQPTEKVYPYAPSITCTSLEIKNPTIPRNYNALVSVDGLTNNDFRFEGEFGCVVYDQEGTILVESLEDAEESGFELGASLFGEMSTPHFLTLDEGEYLMRFMVKTKDGDYYPIHSTYGTTECWKVTVTYGKEPGDVGTVSFVGYDDIDPVITSVGQLSAAEAPATVEYYTLSGTKTSAPARGVVIRKTTSADGTVKTEKVLFKN